MRDEENDRPAWGKPDPLEAEAMTEPQQLDVRIADWLEAGGRERLMQVAAFLADEYDLGEGHEDEIATLERWFAGGTGPRDEPKEAA